MQYYQYSSPIGGVTIVADGDSIVACSLAAIPSCNLTQYQNMYSPTIALAVAWLDNYFAGTPLGLDKLTLRPIGSDFRQEVWQILLSIPYGKTTSYGEIARQVAKVLGKDKMSAQAVGNAVKNNPIAIFIPCHRVIGAGGDMVGYNGGLDIKITLLQHEQDN